MMKCRENNPVRQYLQYNDIVISSAEELTSASLQWDTKIDTQEYSFGHGSYLPLKDDQLFLTEQDLSLSLNIDYRFFRTENRRFINDFLTLNLVKPGKIWAIQDGVLLWAYAYVKSGGEEYDKFIGFLSKDVDFIIPEGYWHIAKKRRTFLLPYDSCDVVECYDFRDVDDCLSCCVTCSTTENTCTTCFCDCGDAVEENSLCGMRPEDLDAFANCGKSYKIIYDCRAGRKIFGEKDWGTKLSKEYIDSSLIAGRIYSNTVLNTDGVDIVLQGTWQDPKITINDISITIEGDYDDGYLKLRPDGSVYYTEDLCCDFEPLDMNKVIYHQKKYFRVHFGENRVIVENSCCGDASIYIDIDEIKP